MKYIATAILTLVLVNLAAYRTMTCEPAGSNAQIQFNDHGDFGAEAGLKWDTEGKTLIINGGSGTTALSIDTLEEFGTAISVPNCMSAARGGIVVMGDTDLNYNGTRFIIDDRYSMIWCQSDMTFDNSVQGTILTDRHTDTHYRLYVDYGVLGIESVP